MLSTEARNDLVSSLSKAHNSILAAYSHYNAADDSRASQTTVQKWLIGFLLVTMFFILSSLQLVSSAFSGVNNLLDFLGVIFECIVVLLIAIPIGALLTWACFLLYKKKVGLQNTIQEETSKGDAIMQNASLALAILPEKYHFPAASGYILEAVSTGRADSLKEAMLQTEDQIHRWNIEANHADMMRQLTEMNTRLKEIQRSIPTKN